MRIYDVTLTISPSLPTWPGDPKVGLERSLKMEAGDVCNLTQMKISAHTGTHVDAPFHFVPDGDTVENLSLKTLTGRAYVVHLPNADLITAEVLQAAYIPPRTRRVLFKTRNSDQWAGGATDFIEDYVALSSDAAEYIVQRGVRLVGVDYLSVAPFDNVAPTHEILLGAGVVVVEGLNLSEVSQGRYTFHCLPLKLANADGAPARAILIGV
ncbi:MAG: cyclase family protein [Anaerolineales bacterium]